MAVNGGNLGKLDITSPMLLETVYFVISQYRVAVLPSLIGSMGYHSHVQDILQNNFLKANLKT